jgi:hypothetical protein
MNHDTSAQGFYRQPYLGLPSRRAVPLFDRGRLCKGATSRNNDPFKISQLLSTRKRNDKLPVPKVANGSVVAVLQERAVEMTILAGNGA